MPDPHPLSSLAFQEANRVLGQQQATLDSIRSRAGVLLSAATISTSFFGAQSIGHRLTGLLPILASILFVAVGVCVTGLLWPRRGLLFDSSLLDAIADGMSLDADAAEGPDADAAIRNFVEQARLHVRANARRLDSLFILLSAGWLLFLGEIMLWLVHAMAV